MTPRKKKTDVAKSAQPKQEIRQASDFETVYANWLQSTFSAYEISIIFGQSFATAPGVPGVEQKLRVAISPLNGKLLAVVLRKVVETYEAQFGKIDIPHVIGDQLIDQLPEIAGMMPPKGKVN